ncbi:flagellar M-ring protein FliF [Pseudomonas sp. ok272]|uniref:flagellar basal-body MS-ring/collar protein FliF n=1 Tax=unclassified Pseudomonas TaxID=196821 RepID=UPI0008BCA24A|nr:MULTISPECIES: flagellar basal-body MS-ring/collar protein FliF [unclassified Pseudomonas]SEM63289.1 flagellar M-ring protein FliF [Pseudomonas sp. ok272]SFM46705.1 flagellar M-ring protein FliF [Pseudomonas sp. ok602]
MLQFIKSKLPANGLKLDPRLSLFGLAAVAAALAVGVVFYLWRDQGAFRPLYGAGEAFPAAEVMQVLDAEALAYRLHPQSGQVLVREDQLARARMLLTAKGVRVAVPAGYELFDKEEPLGTSQFVQDVRLKRSLEGELARTVMTLKGVEQARVHLAMAEGSSFVVSKRDPAKASVMLHIAPGNKLTSEQVGAIVNLVANSVPQLSADHISVVDQHGVLLSRGLNTSNGPVQSWQAVEDYQQKAVANIEEVLAPVLGNGNYRISVAADIDFSQREETFQAYGESPRLRNEVLRDESVLDQLALGVPGSLANRPVAPREPPKPGEPNAAPAPTQTEAKGETSLRKESNRQLDYDQSVTHVKHAPFSLRHQSIAVVLNASTAPEGGWTPQARTDLEALLKSAVGFNQARGDLLTLSVFPFTLDASPLEGAAWWESSQLHDLAKLALFGLISLLLLLMVVRPAIRTLSKPKVPSLAVDDQESALMVSERAERLLGRASSEEFSAINVLGELNPLSEIRLPAPGSGLELQIEHLQMLAKNDPERVSEVIKQWIGRNERDLNPAG